MRDPVTMEENMTTTKESYVRPTLTKHGLLRDITAGASGGGGGHARDRINAIICQFFPRLPRCN